MNPRQTDQRSVPDTFVQTRGDSASLVGLDFLRTLGITICEDITKGDGVRKDSSPFRADASWSLHRLTVIDRCGYRLVNITAFRLRADSTDAVAGGAVKEVQLGRIDDEIER